MANANLVDFALAGSSIKAGMIAGLLAKEHKKRVCLIASRSRQHQLAREFNLSFDCATRDQTWELLAALDTESTKRLVSVGGRRSLLRVNPLIICHTRASANALGHMYHVARGYGYEMERVDAARISGAKAVFCLRGARVIRHRIFWPAMLKWLENCGVQIIDPSDIRFSFQQNGSARIQSGQDKMEAGRVVLADEEAIFQHAGHQDAERFFITCRASSLLSEPMAIKGDQFILSPEHKFAAMGRKKGRMAFLGMVAPQNMAALIGANVALDKITSRAGQSTFFSVATRDGAPIAGRLGRSSFWVLGGFGHGGSYFAPALARFLVNRCSPIEMSYFDSRSADSGRKSPDIAEFQQVLAQQVPARGHK